METLQEEIEDRSDRPTTDAFQQVPRAQRSSVVLVVSDTRTTLSAPATTTSAIPPISSPPSEAFADKLLSTTSTHTGATSQKTPSIAPRDRA